MKATGTPERQCAARTTARIETKKKAADESEKLTF
jgi:hypothetical protein